MNLPNLIRCLGGWCGSRDKCAHYWQESGEWSERLCPKGAEHPEPMTQPEKAAA